MSGTWPLGLSIATFVAGAVIIGVAGSRLVRLVDELADRTGLGEAFLGMALLGGMTSMSGTVLSITAAANDLPELAYSNGVGGIAIQTVFLVVADATFRHGNLEHAAPSLPNLVAGAMLALMLSLALAASLAPSETVLGVHPISPLIAVGYFLGLKLMHRVREDPWWRAAQSEETREDEPEEHPESGPVAVTWLKVLGLAVVTGVAGWALARAGASLAERTVLSDTAVGALFTATTTSLPELVTTLFAVRRGALTLAVGGIVGGNAFDVLMVPAADVAYRPGSLYHAIGPDELLVLATTLAMTAVLILALLVRDRRGVFGVGFDGLLILALYAAMAAMIAVD